MNVSKLVQRNDMRYSLGFADHAGAGASHEAIILKRIIALHAAGHRVSPRVNRLCKLFGKFLRSVLHFKVV